MAAPAGWTTNVYANLTRCWKRLTNGIIVSEEHSVQATAETRATNYDNDKAKLK